MNLRHSVEICLALLVSLAVDNALPLLKININFIQLDKLSDTDARGAQKIDDYNITEATSVFTQYLYCFIAIGFLHFFSDFDFFDFSNGVFGNVILIFQPREKGRHDTSYVVDCGIPSCPFFLKIRKKSTHIRRRNQKIVLPDFS